MPTSLVNSLKVIGAAFTATFALSACNNAQAGGAKNDAQHDIQADAPAVNASASATEATEGSASEAATVQNDSITRAADLGRVQGNASAPIWVIEISDLQCPFCKEWHETTYPKVRDEFIKTGKVRFAYFNFPLSGHKNAMPAARAAMCASVQNKFWEMQDAIFDSQKQWEGSNTPETLFEGLAKNVGLDVSGWKSCIASKSIQSLIDADRARVKQQGVGSTPSFMIDGRLVEGMVPFEDMRARINAAIEQRAAASSKKK